MASAQVVDYGTGVDGISDLPLIFRPVSGLRNLGNDLARRLQIPRGSLPWDLNCGFDVRALLREGALLSNILAVQSAIEAECEKDERVTSCSAQVTYIEAAASLTIVLQITPSSGPTFTLVLAVSDVTVAILRGPQ